MQNISTMQNTDVGEEGEQNREGIICVSLILIFRAASFWQRKGKKIKKRSGQIFDLTF
jgi:hypothetical protein